MISQSSLEGRSDVLSDLLADGFGAGLTLLLGTLESLFDECRDAFAHALVEHAVTSVIDVLYSLGKGILTSEIWPASTTMIERMVFVDCVGGWKFKRIDKRQTSAGRRPRRLE